MLYEYSFDMFTFIMLLLVSGALIGASVLIILYAGTDEDKPVFGVETIFDKLRRPVWYRKLNAVYGLAFLIPFTIAAMMIMLGNHASVLYRYKKGEYLTVSGRLEYIKAPASKRFTVNGIEFYEDRLNWKEIQNGRNVTVAYLTDTKTIIYIKNKEN